MEKQQISVNLDPQLVAALDGIAAQGRSTRSEALEGLVGIGIDARQARIQAEKKQTISVRVSPDVAVQLQGVATARGTSRNQAAEFVLERGLMALVGEQDTAALTAVMDEIKKTATSAQTAHDQQAHRFAFLLSRMVLETLATRQLMGMLLMQNSGEEDARRMAGTAQTLAVQLLKNAPQGTREALTEIVRGMLTDG